MDDAEFQREVARFAGRLNRTGVEPPRGPAKQQHTGVSVALLNQDIAKLDAICKAHGLSRAEYVREAVLRALQDEL